MKVSFYTVDAMRVVDGKITEHWGVATLLDLDAAARGRPSSGRCAMTTPPERATPIS
jgi:hypothetical protein